MDLKDNKLTYDYSEKEFSKGRQTIKVLNWIENDKTVLEFGCHTGLLSKLLVEKKNSIVDGVEINKVALQKANKWLNNSYLLNIEEIQKWKKELGDKKYDYILFLHVLEHLRNPEEVLSEAIKNLSSNGELIIGLPNICNIDSRLRILKGHFEYTETGIMDRTHCSMFSYLTAIQLIQNTNLEIIEYYSPRQSSPLKVILLHMPLFWKLVKTTNPKHQLLTNPNLTDMVMLFRCKIKNL